MLWYVKAEDEIRTNIAEDVKTQKGIVASLEGQVKKREDENQELSMRILAKDGDSDAALTQYKDFIRNSGYAEGRS